MTLLLAAVGATGAALFELTVGPYLRIGGAQPHFVFVLGVVLTIAVGLEAGLVWAFIGGLALDVLAQRPRGSSSFALLLCVGGASVLGRMFTRVRPLAPVIAVPVLSLLYSMVLFVAFGALGYTVPVSHPIETVIPSMLYDTALAILIGPLAVSIHDHRSMQDRMDW